MTTWSISFVLISPLRDAPFTTLFGPWYDAYAWAALHFTLRDAPQKILLWYGGFGLIMGLRWVFAVPRSSSNLPVTCFSPVFGIPQLYIGDAPHINVILMGV